MKFKEVNVLCRIISRSSLFTILIIMALLVGCARNIRTNHEEEIHSNFLDRVSIEVISESVLPEGIKYNFMLKNESEHVIVQNNVYVSFPITNIDRSKFVMNKSKVEATGNRINIEPGDEVTISAFIPKENFKDNKHICSEKPQLELKGYMNTIDEVNHFEMSGDVSYFDSNFKSRYDSHEEEISEDCD